MGLPFPLSDALRRSVLRGISCNTLLRSVAKNMMREIDHALSPFLSFAFFPAHPGPPQNQDAGPVVVTFQEPKQESVQVVLPIDPTQRVKLSGRAGMMFGLTVDNAQLANGFLRTNFKINGADFFPNAQGGEWRIVQPMQGSPFPLKQEYKNGNVTITQILDQVPTKPKDPTAKRPLDAVLIKYVIENQDTEAHSVGVRIRMDMMLVDNDGALFAAPNFPNKILDGIELKGKPPPHYVQVLQRPDLKNPGFVAHFTLKMSNNLIGPDRFLCTFHEP